jgi:hypothetical protein
MDGLSKQSFAQLLSKIRQKTATHAQTPQVFAELTEPRQKEANHNRYFALK